MIDDQNNAVNLEINFFIKDSDNKYTRINEIQTQYIHKTETIKKLLKETGFTCIEIYDDYNEKSYNEKSLRAVFCAKKN
jgi:hypothetical protein